MFPNETDNGWQHKPFLWHSRLMIYDASRRKLFESLGLKWIWLICLRCETTSLELVERWQIGNLWIFFPIHPYVCLSAQCGSSLLHCLLPIGCSLTPKRAVHDACCLLAQPIIEHNRPVLLFTVDGVLVYLSIFCPKNRNKTSTCLKSSAWSREICNQKGASLAFPPFSSWPENVRGVYTILTSG